jgi:hypothetical protein
MGPNRRRMDGSRGCCLCSHPEHLPSKYRISCGKPRSVSALGLHGVVSSVWPAPQRLMGPGSDQIRGHSVAAAQMVGSRIRDRRGACPVRANVRPRGVRASDHVPMEFSPPPAVPAAAPSSSERRCRHGDGRFRGHSSGRRRNRGGRCAVAHHGWSVDLRSSLVAPRWPQPCRRAF